MLITLGLVFIGFGALLTLWTIEAGIGFTLQTALFFAVILVALAYLSSGSLITYEMGAFGVSIWKFALTALIEMSIGAAATIALLQRMEQRHVRA
jgi:hypothetical protein